MSGGAEAEEQKAKGKYSKNRKLSSPASKNGKFFPFAEFSARYTDRAQANLGPLKTPVFLNILLWMSFQVLFEFLNF